MNDMEIRNEPEQNRFVTNVNGREAVVGYSLEEDRIRLQHTRVPPALEGQGIGSKLARFALEHARENDLGVWPDCPFIAEYIRRHPDYLDVVDESYPDRASLEQATD